MTVNVLRYRSWPDAILFIEDPPVLTMRERSRTKDTKTLDPSQTKHHDAQSERSRCVIASIVPVYLIHQMNSTLHTCVDVDNVEALFRMN